ncbi:hypothetical protein L3Y34_006093 [Caenorhabditis briggsae]|uniref:Oxidation resistance protein 1 n=1 Tax=Caenorhabditis briggsae TaxID=6238 RepID=A0AAE9A3D4_CAEBR|nr:hypothetical protein L3Y34_006093 [Caenorhabditis briggsae]
MPLPLITVSCTDDVPTGGVSYREMLSSLVDKVQTSTNSLASTVSQASSEEMSPYLRQIGSSVRRLSMPLGKVRQSSQRRLSQMVSAIGEVIDQEILMTQPGEKSTPLFGSSLLNREWELVTVSEMCRRLSLDQELELPIPDGANTSQILDELMIRQVMDILPPRAEGYPWVNIYNSEKHGFSLATMYRKMAEFDEDLSPVLLIIRDTKEHVFGAVVSSAIRPSDHYFGTGDSCLLWRFTGEAPHTRELRQFNWTGDNQYFVNAAKDSLSIGAGSGRYGLWFDADLNHGRSQKCETFDNEPLCGDNEDFVIQFIEAYGFRM